MVKYQVFRLLPRIAPNEMAETLTNRLAEFREIHRQRGRPRDQDIVKSPFNAMAFQPHRFAQTAADTIAGRRAAEFFRNREAGPGRRISTGRFPALQQKSACVYPLSFGGQKKITAFPQALNRIGALQGRSPDQADSRLRPRARRAAMTLRPPTVPIRERKPWRRLRTIRLG